MRIRAFLSVSMLAIGSLAGSTALSGGCATDPATQASSTSTPTSETSPPPRVKAWMDRLTVRHEYDPKTGFIVAREVVPLPPIVAEAPPVDRAIELAGRDRLVIVFATADRCAPCQQYKRDAIGDPEVVARLADPRFLATHVEVDRSPDLADALLGGRAIPMTYALREGRVVAELRGQRPPSELVAWLDALEDVQISGRPR